ncbi:hypothetical protein IV203_013082 [Nitzschia inconspicua]|uniref:Uncharacterized protein n=1 Tax=Nitzschia inconspicua TaxID=303405 RepID=A0A9K3M4Y8_9STRA|nr:hypothetical protein IV203_013082 [Nitzschia inconspicua]
MKLSVSTHLVVALIALICDHVIAVATDTTQQSDSRFKLRGRHSSPLNASHGKDPRKTMADKSNVVSSFSNEQLLIYRRLGINCGGPYKGKDTESDGYGDGGGQYETVGSVQVGVQNGKDLSSKNGGKNKKERIPRTRRTAMRAFRHGECVCSDDLAVCWRMEYGDTGDDKVCCVPNTDEDDGEYTADVLLPPPIPIFIPANLAPDVDEFDFYDDNSTAPPNMSDDYYN